MQSPYFLLAFTGMKEGAAASSVLGVHQARKLGWQDPVGFPEGNKECRGAALGTSAAHVTLSPVNDRVRHQVKITWGTLSSLWHLSAPEAAVNEQNSGAAEQRAPSKQNAFKYPKNGSLERTHTCMAPVDFI